MRVHLRSAALIGATLLFMAGMTTPALARPQPGPPPPCSNSQDIAPASDPASVLATAVVCVQYTRSTQIAQAGFQLDSFVPEDDNDAGLDNCDEGDPFCGCEFVLIIQDITKATIDRDFFDCGAFINDAGVHDANSIIGVNAAPGDQVVATVHVSGEFRTSQQFEFSLTTPVWMVNTTF